MNKECNTCKNRPLEAHEFPCSDCKHLRMDHYKPDWKRNNDNPTTCDRCNTQPPFGKLYPLYNCEAVTVEYLCYNCYERASVVIY